MNPPPPSTLWYNLIISPPMKNNTPAKLIQNVFALPSHEKFFMKIIVRTLKKKYHVD